MDTRKENSKTSSAFLSIYRLILICIIILIAIGLSCLWLALDDYEKSVPDNVMDKISQNLCEKEYECIIESTDISFSEFEDASYLNNYLEKSLSSGTVSYSKISGNDESKVSYLLYSDENKLAKVELKEKSQKSKFGFSEYEIDKMSDILKANQEITVLAPSTAKVFLNGIEVSSKYVIENDICVQELKNIPDLIEKPTMVKYHVDGLYFEPVVTVKGFLGNELKIFADEETGDLSALPNGSNEMYDMYSPLVIEVAQTYAKFVSKDAQFSELAKYFSKEILLYKKLANLYVQDYTEHDKYEFENIKTSDFMMYNENWFSCNISFDYNIYRANRNKTYSFPSDFTFSFIKKDDTWLVADMVINS